MKLALKISLIVFIIGIFSGIAAVYFLIKYPGEGPTSEEISWLDENYDYILNSRDENTFVSASWDMRRDYFKVSESCLDKIKKNIRKTNQVAVGKDKNGVLSVMVNCRVRFYIYGRSSELEHIEFFKHVKNFKKWDVWLMHH